MIHHFHVSQLSCLRWGYFGLLSRGEAMLWSGGFVHRAMGRGGIGKDFPLDHVLTHIEEHPISCSLWDELHTQLMTRRRRRMMVSIVSVFLFKNVNLHLYKCYSDSCLPVTVTVTIPQATKNFYQAPDKWSIRLYLSIVQRVRGHVTSAFNKYFTNYFYFFSIYK